jgi:hypothetical protein
MRSFPLKTALAALVLSTSLATAYAASTPPLDPLQKEAIYNHGARADVDAMRTGSITKATPVEKAAPMRKQAAVHSAQYRPRLAMIVRDIDAADHRMQIDRHRGFLTRAEYRTLRSHANAIHADALRTASDHHGALPHAKFVSLQQRVDRLGRDIHRDATT